EKHGIELIAVGNGTASRETDVFIHQTISKINEGKRPICVIVSEAGASVYSASKTAGEEFPDFDVTVRGAISIGRRLQDPLSELVKIDPKAIGVGQYQHDVNQADLKSALEEVVESCVNLVGANLNLSSVDLLKYVAGLNQTTASNIVTFREKNGAFASREELKKVPGIGEKSFQQAAGFLRIPDAANPLDNSAVHPERYSLVKEMASDIKMPLETIIGNVDLVREIPKEKFISEDVGLPTIEDILRELEKPGRDPREEFQYAQFSEEIKEITDLESGMVLEGTVTNVTNFGAFVDIGVHQDGLVHISQISDCYVDDPRKFVKVGQIVKVKVLKVDTDLMRIALSLKI
ncbi:MAG: helix-hairpin-helix domain-containing protein, partial [Candidatus Aminicenantaceae bacterium]